MDRQVSSLDIDTAPALDDALEAATPETPRLSAEDFREIGEAIGAPIHWQAYMGDVLLYSKSMMTRVCKGTRPISAAMAAGVRRLLYNRMEELAVKIDTPGLPSEDPAEIARLKGVILEAVSALKTLDTAYAMYYTESPAAAAA